MRDDGNQTTSPAVSAPRRRARVGLSIQSKLLVMLLVTSLIASIIVGLIGVLNGRESLNEAAVDQLTTIRELRADAIEREFKQIQTGVELDSRNASAIQGTQDFVEGFADLASVSVSGEQQGVVNDFYVDSFTPALEQRSGLKYDSSTFVPATPAGVYLQYHYTAQREIDDFDAGLALSDAGDGSSWSAANAQWGPYFEGLVNTLNYEDILLLNPEGDVVYSAFKSADLGISLHEEPYAGSALTIGFDELRRSGSLDNVVTTDFERYLPSLGVPTAWVLSPVGSATDLIGVLAVQVPIEQINDVMTGGESWQNQGLGDSGEVYLAGPDKLMRSASRLLSEDPEAYEEAAIRNGTPTATVNRVLQVDGTVLLQPTDTYAVQKALAGETGVSEGAEYASSSSLVAYSPLEIEGLDWVVVAHIDTAEAFAPVATFTRTLLISLVAILLGVSLISLLLAQVFTRPIRKLVEGVRRVAGGELDVQVPEGSRDEFGDLGAAFNDMSASLRVKQELIDQQQSENQELLLTLMPESVAAKHKQGDETIAEAHDNVSVVFAELVGFDDYALGLSSEEEISQLNRLMRGFDEAASKAGVEKVRTLRGGYLASSGLSVPRVDNVRRTVDFAVQVSTMLTRFNSQNGTSLALRAGVDSGTVTSGLVARTSLAYDLWGDAVSLAYRVRSVSREPGIYVSDTVKQRTEEVIEYIEAGSVESHGKSETVWKVS